MNIFLTVSNDLYQNQRDYCVKLAKTKGQFDKILSYQVETLMDTDFKHRNNKILSIKRGAGLWLWKVYAIEKALREVCSDGDILFYADASSFFFRNAHTVLDSFQGNIFAVETPYMEEEFTKNKTFELLKMTDDKYRKTRQFHASFMAFRKCKDTIDFVDEWLNYSCNYDVISDPVDSEKEISLFRAHRNDQSIFSLLCKKYDVLPSLDPSQYGITPYGRLIGQTYLPTPQNSLSGFCIMLHKEKQWKKKDIIKSWLKILKRILIKL